MRSGLGLIEPDTLVDEDLLRDLDWDIQIPCEIPSLIRANGSGFPYCNESPATWVAWRPNCCPASPRYLLICDQCKETYQRWAAKQALIVCPWCGSDIGGHIAYTPLRKS